MVKAMGRRRRGSKTGGVEPATISLAVLAAIAGVAGYGSTRGELSVSDQLKVEAAVRSRLEAERARNPRSAPCPDFKSERDALLKRLADYESSEIRFRLATPQQIVEVIDIVKQQLGVPKKGGTIEEAVKEIEDMESTSEPTSVATSEPVTETPVEPVAPVTETPVEPVAPVTETPVEPVAPVTETPVEPVTETPVEPVAVEPVAPVQAEISKTPDLTQAGAILDSVPKAISRPRLITILIKLENATTQSLETLRKYFDDAFKQITPASTTPLKDWWKKMTTRGEKKVEPVVPPVVAPEPVVPPVVAPEPVVTPVVAPEPVVTPVVAPEPVVTPVVAPTPEPVVTPDFTDRAVRVEKMKQGTLRAGTRKKKLRTRRRDKQNVRRSSGGKNRSNRTDTYSSRRTEVDARGDELGL